MRVFSISSVWIILGIFLTFLCIVSLRLGLKASSLTETDIIMHYSAIYFENERAEGRTAQLTELLRFGWNRDLGAYGSDLRTQNAAPYKYVIGFWGQLMYFSRNLNVDSVPRA